MTSFRKTALVGGILYLITFIGSIPAAILVGPAINDPSYVTGAGADQQVTLGALLELVNVFGLIGCGIAFFSVVRREHEGLAIGYLATRLFEGAIITVGVVSLLAIVTLRQHGAVDGNAETLVPVSGALVAIRSWAMVLGPNMAAFNALMLATALYRARLVPRALPALGLVGAPILISHVVLSILGFTPGTVFTVIAVMPFFIWELVLGLWLTFKGFNESAPIAVAERARLAPAGAVAKAGAA
ncbi:MAG: DUF4386 domain-containing protein [Chloroflexota bacterium]|nr:MAG: DUF4386 domain-containing protein [Chloroflexota bacterium]